MDENKAAFIGFLISLALMYGPVMLLYLISYIACKKELKAIEKEEAKRGNRV